MKKQFQDESDFFSFMTKIQEQLFILDKKVDTLMNRSLPQAKPAFQPPVHNVPLPGSGRPDDRPKGRPMFKAICADCQKECELPFKPSGERPVYCKECFSRRKSGNALKVPSENKPKEMPPVQATIHAASTVPEPISKEKKKPAAAKKSTGKKLVPKKKKSKK